MSTAKQAIYTQTAKAKLLFVKNKNTYKLVCAFNVFEKTTVFGHEKYKFPVQAKCDYVSGDISAETLAQDLPRVMQTASEVLRTNNIILV